MSVELSLLVMVIAFVALVVAAIASLIYALMKLKALTLAATEAKQELVTVTEQLKPLIEHTDTTIQTINESMRSGAMMMKNSKQITHSVAFTLQALQDITHTIAQKAESKLKDEATHEQAQLTLQWTELIMMTVKMLQQRKQQKYE